MSEALRNEGSPDLRHPGKLTGFAKKMRSLRGQRNNPVYPGEFDPQETVDLSEPANQGAADQEVGEQPIDTGEEATLED